MAEYMQSKQAKQANALSAPVKRNADRVLDTLDAILKQTIGEGINSMIEEHVKKHIEDEADVATSLDSLAELITERIAVDANGRTLPVSLMLMEPLSLTVKRANKPNNGYSKKAHTGGEEFSPVRCYPGKRGSLIYVFKPLAVADYIEMEMPESMAKTALSGFETWIKGVIDPDLDRARKEAQQASSVKAEREKLAARAEQYGDGFGSW